MASNSASSNSAADDETVPSREGSAERKRRHEQGPREDSASTGVAAKPSESRLSRIAKRAHEIYEARGVEHGKALEDWLQAEREVDEETP